MTKKDDNKIEYDSMLKNLLCETEEDEKQLSRGLTNLSTLPSPEEQPPVVKGKEYDRGVMGLKKPANSTLSIAIACGKAQVRYISLKKYIALVENLHDPESATIMIQNFNDGDNYKSAKGQVLARINAESSAITIIQGVTGRIVRSPQDIALYDVYYLDRRDMTSFYLTAKAQISNGDALETMIQAYEGWKAFNVPLDPLNPYED